MEIVPINNSTLIVSKEKNSTITIVTTMASTSESPKDVVTPNSQESWMGLNPTHILVLFISIVLAVLIIFVILYYCFVKGTRKETSQGKLGQKSVSGSINEPRGTTIFDHPERQLAVDSSVRMTPNSSASSDTTDRSGITSPYNNNNNNNNNSNSNINNATGTISPRQSPQVTEPHISNQSRKSVSDLSRKAPGIVGSQADQASRMRAAQPGESTSTSTSPAQTSSRKSSSDSKKRRQVQPDPHSILGALAGLRDTLKETESNR